MTSGSGLAELGCPESFALCCPPLFFFLFLEKSSVAFGTQCRNCVKWHDKKISQNNSQRCVQASLSLVVVVGFW